ncbi:hypothetical protein [Nakamurella aerolata]|uniref:Uncharacterized protein n=1 Tax=Nakamurella aerolata TaxID=1656892 RepID=A0A849AA69_9ACTN|nr:hypothetical protein [Nakamurella aerolata]NNG37435.1 hypothetical protein [Nakamurella aerolata]
MDSADLNSAGRAATATASPHGPAGHRPAVTRIAASPASHQRRTLEFFTHTFTVVGDELPDLGFHFGPHLARTRRADFQVEITGPALPGQRGSSRALEREVRVRRADGVSMLRRPLVSLHQFPPALPPFAALGDRYAIRPATVVHRGPTTLALTGTDPSECAELALALCRLGWRLVSSQLLVIDRRIRRTLALHTPLRLRGAAAADIAASTPDDAVQTCQSALTGPTLLVRPEAVGAIVPLHAELPLPLEVRICRGRADLPRLRGRCEQPSAFWPPEAAEVGRALNRVYLEIPRPAAADEVALEMHRQLSRPNAAERLCHDERATVPAPRAGSIA